jgi:hypothetical protein
MQFATLQEAFPDAYKKKSTNLNDKNDKTDNNDKNSSKNDKNDKNNDKNDNDNNLNNYLNPYRTDEDCYYTKEGIKLGSCKDADKIVMTNATGSEIVTKNCSPLQVPEYKLPIKRIDYDKTKRIVESSLTNNNSRDDNITMNKYSIKPYDYDEYDAYLNINDITTNNIDNSPEYRTTPLLKDYLLSLRNNFKKKTENVKLENVEQFTNYTKKKITVDINIYNLLLFMFIGIVILILCDQVVKLAVIIARNKNI